MSTRINKAFTLISLVLAMALGSAHAQSGRTLRFNIPFDSTAGKTSLPAGEYTVRFLNGTGGNKTILIQSADGSVKLATLAMSTFSRHHSSERARLVFNRYGDQYFLSQVWDVASDYGQELNKSKAEREIAKGAQVAQRKAEQLKVELLAQQ